MSCIDDVLNDVTKKATSLLIKSREDQVLQILKNRGFEFKNKGELATFAKTRCAIGSYVDGTKNLMVDGEYICHWNDSYLEVRVEHEIDSIIIHNE